VRALQALAEGKLLAPGAGCDACDPPFSCGECKTTNKLLIPAFPGSGKSDTISEWAAWMIGRATLEGHIPVGGYTSYSDDVAQDRSVAIRDTIYVKPNEDTGEIPPSTQKYHLVFPDARPDKRKAWGRGSWFLWRSNPTKKDPTLRAAGWGAAIHAYRFTHFNIVDDPHDPVEVRSPGMRDEVWRMWRQTISTRSQRDITPFVMICNRFAEDDLPGRIMAIEKDWHVIWTPALENEETVWPVEVVNGEPMGNSTEALLQRREEDRLTFLTQDMCLPPSEEGGMFRFFPCAHREPMPNEISKIVQTWDTAQTAAGKKGGSYSVGITFLKLMNGARAYIWNVYRAKKDPKELSDDILECFLEAERRWGRSPLVLVENKASGPALVSFLKAYHSIGPYIRVADLPGNRKRSLSTGRAHGQADLVQRSAAASLIFDAGSILLPPQGDFTDPAMKWREAFVSELKAFPNGQYQDQVAALVLGTEHIFPSIRTVLPRLPVSIPGW
jgi:phage terminase large subunit-like protein